MSRSADGCQFPQNTPGTAYGKGCRCDRCRGEKAEWARAYREANREKVAEHERAYREANREKESERSRAYREANREKVAERKRAYYEANREKVAEYERAYREANREKMLERDRAYREANREELAERGRARSRRDPDYFQAKARRAQASYQAKSAKYATVAGPYSTEENRIVRDFVGTDLQLALTLKRTFSSVVSHKCHLRKKGLL